ncbi:MAG: hypothetical protein JJV95_04450 [Sulfurospirillum sp.]|nr:hypothetical protein [Sulfurospirillum sp.]
MESWILSLVIALVGVVSSFAVIKQKVNEGVLKDTEQDIILKEIEKFMNERSPYLDHLFRFEIEMKKKTENHTSQIVKLQQETLTMTEVRNEFVSKEMFRQMEKHIDEKFVKLENGIEKILTKLESN